MINRTIFTPFFLDRYQPGFEPVVAPDWIINRPELPAGSTQERMIALYRPLASLVAGAVGRGERPVSFAGDCCTTLAVMAGLQRAGIQPTLIWLDAHGDFNTWKTTPSGFLGGMPLAMLVGRGDMTMPHGLSLRPHPESQVILCDGRDLDPGEREAVAGSGMLHLLQAESLLVQPLPDGPLYVHFDTDLLDPSEAPAMNYPTPGGPSTASLRPVFARLAATRRVIAVSLSAWNPELDGTGRSREAVMGLMPALLG